MIDTISWCESQEELLQYNHSELMKIQDIVTAKPINDILQELQKQLNKIEPKLWNTDAHIFYLRTQLFYLENIRKLKCNVLNMDNLEEFADGILFPEDEIDYEFTTGVCSYVDKYGYSSQMHYSNKKDSIFGIKFYDSNFVYATTDKQILFDELNFDTLHNPFSDENIEK